MDGKPFGANICYSEPDKFGLNPAQGSTFKPIPEEKIPPAILSLASSAAQAHGLRIAAVDIAMDGHIPRIVDMNASPDLSFTNARGKKLNHALAKSIQELALSGGLTDFSMEVRGRGHDIA